MRILGDLYSAETVRELSNDALAALAMLGYSTADVAPVLRQISTEGMSSEQIIRAVLKFMV